MENSSSRYNTGAPQLERSIYNFCNELMSKNIPFDRIRATSEPGIVLTSSKHRKILEDFIKENYEKNHSVSILPKIKWEESDSVHYIKNLTINDVLYNYIPLNFTFEPLITIYNKECKSNFLYPSYKWLGLPRDDEIKYSEVVPFKDFINEMNIDGFHVLFDGKEIKTFEEYFEHMKKILYSSIITVDVNFNDSNNIRR